MKPRLRSVKAWAAIGLDNSWLGQIAWHKDDLLMSWALHNDVRIIEVRVTPIRKRRKK